MFDCITSFIGVVALGPTRERRPVIVGNRFTFGIGSAMDRFAAWLNVTIFKRRPIKTSFVDFFAVGSKEVNRTSRLVTRSVSFGLLLFCIEIGRAHV